MKSLRNGLFFQDIRYGFRMLVKSPGFAAIAILTLALGIGANTAIFSVVNGVLLNALPFPHSDQIVSLFQKMPNFENASISYPNFEDWRRMNRTFTTIAAYRPSGFSLSGNGEPEHVQGEMISHGFFEILGLNPVLGRTFREDDDHIGAEPTAMITEGLWKRKFGGARDIVGRSIVLNDISRTIIGVVPSNFHLVIQNFQQGSQRNDVYVPIGEYNEPAFHNNRGAGWGMDAIGRLKPGITLQQAREDMNRVAHELSVAYPDVNASKQMVTIWTLKDEMVGKTRPALLVLLGAVVFVLLISCVNVANLLLARSTSRQREFAIRLSLGAGPRRIVRQLLTESVMMALAGGALGLLLAKFGIKAAIAAVPSTLPRAEQIGLDLRVLLFTFGVSLVAGIVFGLAPALKIAKADVSETLKESGRSVAAARTPAQNIFVAGEMAMALILLVGAGLMLRSLFVLWGLNPGFNPHNVLTFSVSAPESLGSQSAEAIRTALRQFHEKLAATPGVEAVSLSWGSDPMGSDNDGYFAIVGQPMPAHMADLPMALNYVVEPDYLKAMQISLKRGRFFTDADNENASSVAVIDERMADKYFAGKDPIGQYLDLNTNPEDQVKFPKLRIIGVVGHVNQWGLATDSSFPLQAQMYLSLMQTPDAAIKEGHLGFNVYVRTARAGVPSFQDLRQAILATNRDMVVFDPAPMDKNVADSIAAERFTMTLLAVFAVFALVLAGIGIYGVLSYLVGQRTQEIGVRMALGAQRFDVMRMVLRDGARMVGIGIGIGILAALGLTQLMASMLFGVKPTDPVTFAAVAVLLCAIALLACYVPARRAMKVDPIVALRCG
ncbi:MAG TPA: ABC transporter permease [Terriglobales bacterium]|nr:ABC transporter permease [Terriglobales bacterium]